MPKLKNDSSVSVVDRMTAYGKSSKRDSMQTGGKKFNYREFNQLVSLIKEGGKEFIYEPITVGQQGFGIRIYGQPIYPCVPPILLVVIFASLPDELITSEDDVSDAFRILSPFSHSEENKQFLREHKLEQPREIGHYYY